MNKKILLGGIIIVGVFLIVYLFWNIQPENKQESNSINSQISNSKPDYSLIKEWGLKYKIQNTQLPYVYRPASYFPKANLASGFNSLVNFKYMPSNEEDSKWAFCVLPTIAQYTLEPTLNNTAGAIPSNVKEIGGRYYLYDDSLHEPCYLNGETIKGEAEKEWRHQRNLIRDIFEVMEVK